MKNKRQTTVRKKKKPYMIYVYIGIIVVVFGAIFALGKMNVNELYGVPTSELNPATRVLLDDPNYQNIILPDELDKRIADKDDFFAYMFSASCQYCKDTTPHLVPLANELNVDLPMFNLLEFPEYNLKMNIDSTPTLVYFQDGVETDRLVGGIQQGTTQGNTIEDFRTFFEKHAGADAE
ncbi:thioredoxin family protein [Paenibacillus soyae]|uniref:Thioredoxin family protein n=1 Tax=Paenibacillus soyae TaxID=2969249 RepID=A0A9X2MMY0_9BACL|nr:thioredoxin family protein [Paenibacillus soyae]MCR2803230.1 thioredoxin family protein [Paenibacillus soyae]